MLHTGRPQLYRRSCNISGPQVARCPVPALKHGVHARRGAALILQASEKAITLLAEGKRVYESGDRLAAMGVYEQVLKEGAALSPEQRRAALYGTVAVHASFGDVELAQMALRDAVQAGLDFTAAQEDPTLPQISSSQQIIIQLNRFNKQLLRNLELKADDRAAAAARPPAYTSSAFGGSDVDLSRLLGGSTDKKDELGIDASPRAIAVRVAGVVLALSALGVVLFLLGLKYMFPPF